MNVPTVNWTGWSGRVYQYYVYPLPVNLNPNQEGNYIFAKQDSMGRWVPIYIGQGNLSERANNHHQAACIRNKSATHFHCHLNASENDRIAEEAALLKRYTQAYQPVGCNERPGG